MAPSHADKAPNRLINQSSPYLLQHAYNPVDWYPWGEEALNKAKAEDKPIIVSIGYSSCHWCHVMERESFENDEIATIMNRHFINIKVDREERPDVDQIYMDALQSMNIQGGWPLNVFLTSDAKPFYGGTYFPPAYWINLLTQISNAFNDHRAELEKSADDFTRVLNYSEAFKYELKDISKDFTKEDLDTIYSSLEKKFDRKLGGKQNAPKFPMPSIYLFLLRYYSITKNEEALRHIKLTLDKMAMGGIYDQTGGGFARYSTDEEWFAPHFEKMLYDNGQLLSLYAEAFTVTHNSFYKEVVEETIKFVDREMTSAEGGFYSALDADTEGIEGKYYVWYYNEIKELIGTDSDLFIDYYNIKQEGNWEHEFNILHRKLTDTAFANKHKLPVIELTDKVKRWKEILMLARDKRAKPGVDDKVLTSWNGMMLKGLLDAYRALDEEKILNLALKNAHFIQNKLREGNKLFHSYKNGKATVDGFLEDYAFVIQGYISLYQSTFDENWLNEAKALAEYVINHFWDEEEEMFYFTSDSGEKLIARKKEIFDNVIPASNSVMAQNLFMLGVYFENQRYSDIAENMIGRVKKLLIAEPSYLSNWGCLFTNFVNPIVEVAISGKDFISYRKELDKVYHPNLIFAGTAKSSTLPLLEGRNANGETMIYVCSNKACKIPVYKPAEALKQIE